MSSKCLACAHLVLFQEIVPGRGIDYLGACAHPARAALGRTTFCAGTENFAYSCQDFESAADAAIRRAVLETEDA